MWRNQFFDSIANQFCSIDRDILLSLILFEPISDAFLFMYIIVEESTQMNFKVKQTYNSRFYIQACMYTVKLHSQKFISWRDIAKVYPLTNKINVVLIKPKLSVNFINQQDQPVPKEKAVALSRLTSSQISASVSFAPYYTYTLYGLFS